MQNRWTRWVVVAIPYLWLVVLFLVPFLIVLKISFSMTAVAQPPYTPVIDFANGIAGVIEAIGEFTVDNYVWLTEDTLYLSAYLSSLWIALVSTALTLLVAYPIAYGMARAPKRWQATLVMLVILPFWTSFLIRVYSWIGILKKEGLLNQFLLWSGLIDQPLTILNTDWAVYIGIIYSYLPFMVLPLYAALERLDDTLLEAAADLGSTPLRSFWQITFPLSLPGVIAGCFLVFIPAVGEFVIPALLDPAAYPKNQVLIFNRWGDEVFRSNGAYKNNWDGTFNGEDLPADTYFYIIEPGNGEPAQTGFVVIQR